MKKSIFVAGFGVSVMLLAVCAWYAFASPMRSGVLEAFDVANRGWYVHQPAAYNVCLLVFAVLNLPVIFAFWGVVSLLDSFVTLTAVARAVGTFAFLLAFSGIWWALVARWIGKRTRIVASNA